MIEFYLQLLAVCFFGIAMAGNYPCCCATPCECCSLATTPSATPRDVIVTFTGVVNGSCGTCDDWNDTAWVLRNSNPLTLSGVGSQDSPCYWYLGDGLPCSFELLQAFISCEAPGTGIEQFAYTVSTFETFAGGSEDGFFSRTLSTTVIDCTDPGAQTYYSFLSDNSACDWSSATCDVSS